MFLLSKWIDSRTAAPHPRFFVFSVYVLLSLASIALESSLMASYLPSQIRSLLYLAYFDQDGGLNYKLDNWLFGWIPNGIPHFN